MSHSGEWGTVCNDGFTSLDVQVACRELGCAAGTVVPASTFGQPRFGQGTGKIWLDEVGCSGSESYLTSCSHRGWGVHNCNHLQDVGIQCEFDAVDATSSPSQCSGLVFAGRCWSLLLLVIAGVIVLVIVFHLFLVCKLCRAKRTGTAQIIVDGKKETVQWTIEGGRTGWFAPVDGHVRWDVDHITQLFQQPASMDTLSEPTTPKEAQDA